MLLLLLLLFLEENVDDDDDDEDLLSLAYVYKTFAINFCGYNNIMYVPCVTIRSRCPVKTRKSNYKMLLVAKTFTRKSISFLIHSYATTTTSDDGGDERCIGGWELRERVQERTGMGLVYPEEGSGHHQREM